MESWSSMNTKKNPAQPARPRVNLAARRQVLALWRGVDLEPLEKAAARTTRPASKILVNVLRDLRMDQRQSETEVIRVWNHLIDPTLVAHAQPVGIRKGTLFVNVDNSVWLSEIVRYRSKEILERLQLSFGKDFIARISYRLG